MNKTILILAAIVAAFLAACNGRKSQPDDFRTLNDSIVKIYQQASMRRDTARLEEALRLSDELQKLAETTEQKRLFYFNRGHILTALGLQEEAKSCLENYIETLPEDSPGRLHHNEWKTLWDRHLTLIDKYENDSRKNKIEAILANWRPSDVQLGIPEEIYTANAVLILEDCKSAEDVKNFIKRFLENIDIEISLPIPEAEIDSLSNEIFKATEK